MIPGFKTLSFIKHLLCTTYYTLQFMCIILFHSHSGPKESHPFLQVTVNEVRQKLGKLLISGRRGTQTQIILTLDTYF